jgi:hypothetical protein
LEKDVLQRVAPAVFGTPQRREFPREKTVLFLLRLYSKYAEHPQRLLLYSFAHFPVVMVRVATLLIYLSKIRQIEYRQSKNCSAGNPPPEIQG